MGADTAIKWADHTFNPWTGCTRVSPGCDHCYAAAQAKRNPATFGSWEPGGARKRTSAANWRQPLAWNRKAQAEGRRMRVFCASMADVFDNQVPEEWRQDLWHLIARTDHLDWLLLTKRPQNIAAMLPAAPVGHWAEWGAGWPNVWLGTTVENQVEAERRIPHLMAAPAAKRFLSCEPLLGPVDLRRIEGPSGIQVIDALFGESTAPDWSVRHARINWVIAGGESGPGARPMHPDWARSLRDQCAEAGVPFFFKQWGDFVWRATGERATAIEGGFAIPASAVRVGKKAAGRLLDGREHSEVPAP